MSPFRNILLVQYYTSLRTCYSIYDRPPCKTFTETHVMFTRELLGDTINILWQFVTFVRDYYAKKKPGNSFERKKNRYLYHSIL